MTTEQRLEKIDRVVSSRQANLCVVLEDVHDPHNAEAVFRSCDAFGVQDIHLVFDKQAEYNPQKIGKKTSSSANKWLDFYTYTSTEECMKELKRSGWKCIATTISDFAESIYTIQDNDTPLAIWLGNEHRGLSETAIQLADAQCYIPMAGMVQSLNISVTAAILIYEITRQRHTISAPKSLPLEIQERLRNDFITRQ